MYRTIKHKLLSTEEVLVRMQRRWTDIKRPPYKLEKASASLVGPLGVSWKTRLYRCLYNTPALQHQKSLLFLNSVLSFLEDFSNISSCICNLCFNPHRCSIRTFTSRVYFSFKGHSVSCLAAEQRRRGIRSSAVLCEVLHLNLNLWKDPYFTSFNKIFPIFVSYFLLHTYSPCTAASFHLWGAINSSVLFLSLRSFFFFSVQVLLKLWRKLCFIYSVCLPQSQSVLGVMQKPNKPRSTRLSHTQMIKIFTCGTWLIVLL